MRPRRVEEGERATVNLCVAPTHELDGGGRHGARDEQRANADQPPCAAACGEWPWPRDRPELRILGENAALQVLQLRPGLDPELVDEAPSRNAVRLERVCL